MAFLDGLKDGGNLLALNRHRAKEPQKYPKGCARSLDLHLVHGLVLWTGPARPLKAERGRLQKSPLSAAEGRWDIHFESQVELVWGHCQNW